MKFLSYVSLFLIAIILSSCLTYKSDLRRAYYYESLNRADQAAYDRFLRKNRAIVTTDGFTYYFQKRTKKPGPFCQLDSKIELHYQDKVITEDTWADSSFEREEIQKVNGLGNFNETWQKALQLTRAGDRIAFLQAPSNADYLREEAKGRLLLFEVQVLKVE